MTGKLRHETWYQEDLMSIFTLRRFTSLETLRSIRQDHLFSLFAKYATYFTDCGVDLTRSIGGTELQGDHPRPDDPVVDRGKRAVYGRKEKQTRRSAGKLTTTEYLKIGSPRSAGRVGGAHRSSVFRRTLDYDTFKARLSLT